MPVNQVMIEGTVGSLKPNEKNNYVYMSLAHDRKYKQNNKKVEEVHWFNIALFNGAAEWAMKNVRVGDRVLIMGRLLTDSYEKDGEQRSTVRIIANVIRVTARKGDKNQELEVNEGEIPDETPEVNKAKDVPF